MLFYKYAFYLYLLVNEDRPTICFVKLTFTSEFTLALIISPYIIMLQDYIFEYYIDVYI